MALLLIDEQRRQNVLVTLAPHARGRAAGAWNPNSQRFVVSGGDNRATGPLPADTLFTRANLEGADAVLAMYHDQGLPVLKYASFGHGINVTLGLPIIRTSVDHGTALDLAGTGRADSQSLLAAVQAALDMVGSSAAHAVR